MITDETLVIQAKP